MINAIVIPLLLTILGMQLRNEHRMTKIETSLKIHFKETENGKSQRTVFES